MKTRAPIAFLAFFLIAGNVFAAKTFEAWSKDYASTAVVRAFNKTSDFPIAPTAFRHTMRYSQPWSFLGQMDVLADTQSERHQAIVKNISHAVDSAADGELVVVHVGAMHALEFAFSGRNRTKSVLYSFAPLRQQTKSVDIFGELSALFQSEKTSFNKKEIERSVQLLQQIFPSHTAADSAETLISATEAISYSFLGETPNDEAWESLFAEITEEAPRATKPKAIIFADVHHLDQTSQISSFPAADLVGMGYKKITFLFEPFTAGIPLDAEMIQNSTYLASQLAEDKALMDFASKISSGLKTKLLSSTLVISPANLELLNLATAARRAGLQVEFKGVEKPGVIEAMLHAEAKAGVERIQASTRSCESLFR